MRLSGADPHQAAARSDTLVMRQSRSRVNWKSIADARSEAAIGCGPAVAPIPTLAPQPDDKTVATDSQTQEIFDSLSPNIRVLSSVFTTKAD
jgi:hypothetical protein